MGAKLSIQKKENLKKKYVLLDDETLQNTTSIFTGVKPIYAAKKAANRGYSKILLRQTGTDTIHVYDGSFTTKRKKKNDPVWLPSEYKVALVKKIETTTLNKLHEKYFKKTRSGQKY